MDNNVTSKELQKRLDNLAKEVTKLLVPQRTVYKIKYCTNKWCLENQKDIQGYLKTETKTIPLCAWRKLCPDGKYHYFNYKPVIEWRSIK